MALCAGSAVLFLLMIPVTSVLERWRLRKVTAAFLKDRLAMSDDEFLRRLAAEPEHADFYLAGRRAMAHLSGVPAEVVHPKDTVRSLLDLQFDNGYLQDLLFALEDATGGTFKEDALRVDYPKPTTKFGAFLRELAQNWQHSQSA
jgi:hypothetical protein